MNYASQKMIRKSLRARGLVDSIVLAKLNSCQINMADGNPDGGGSGEEAKSDAGERQQEQQQAQGGAQQDAINDPSALSEIGKIVEDPAAGTEQQT